MSQIVYRLDDSITGEEWTKAMVRSMSNSFNCRLAKNPTLEEAINDLTGCRSNGVRIIFETNAPVQVAATVLKMIFGSRIFNHGAFGIVGHGKKLSKPDPAFFTDLVLPELLSKGVSLAHTISIGDRVDDDGIAAIEAGMPGAIIVDGPDGLLQALQEIKKLKKIEP